jgi:AAA ATPase domain
MSAGAELAAGGREATVLRGEAGIGKTTLLAEAQRLAAHCGLQVLTCRRVRAEANLPFAGLHQLLRPVLSFLPGLPAGQEDLLRAALGLDDNVLADRYRVALATLELLAGAAAKAPVPVLADDAHWALKAPGPAGQEQRSARQERGRGGRGP